jgi:hypothetical protein
MGQGIETTSTPRRYRANPVEVAIFTVVSLVFVNSVYQLFFDQGTFRPVALAPSADSPLAPGAGAAAERADRAPAARVEPSLDVEVPCDGAAWSEVKTAAATVRFKGALCGSGAPLKVSNVTHSASAAVTADAVGFSSEALPLAPGVNAVRVEGSAGTREWVITRE